MNGTYCKLSVDILYSSLWDEPPDIKVVWITLLAMKDRYGMVRSTLKALAMMARVPEERTAEALRRFMAPDPKSRSQKDGGCRIQEVEGGWLVVNHEKYRQLGSDDSRREYQREYKREWRAGKRRRSRVVEHPDVPGAESEAEVQQAIADGPARQHKTLEREIEDAKL